MEQSIPSSSAFSSNCRLLLWLESAGARQGWDPPASATSLLVTTARLMRTTLSLSTPVDTSRAPSPPVSSSVPTTQNTSTNKRWKHYQDVIRRDQYKLSATTAIEALRVALRWKSLPGVAPQTSNSLPQTDLSNALPRADCLAGSPAESYNITLKQNSMAKSTSADLCAHEN